MFPDGVESLAGGLPAQDKAVVWATQVAPSVDLLDAQVSDAAWKIKPAWYVIAGQDRTIQPDLQRFFAKRMGATTYELDSGHMVMLSHPEVVVDVIREAATTLQGSRAGSVARGGRAL
jgi:pimeloyl-ACP methyl ester carboxylesterase